MQKLIIGLLSLSLFFQWLPQVRASDALQISGVILDGLVQPGLSIQQVTVNDPLFSQQSSLALIGAPAAWSFATGSSSPIAVIDTGIDLQHEDLVGRLWVNNDEVPSNGIDDDNNGYIDDYRGYNFLANNSDIADVHGHGTGIASIIAAQTNNNRGMAGLNWSAPIMVLKALNSLGGGDFSTVSTALRYAADNGARVVNMSFGAYNYTAEMTDAVNYALNKNVIIVAAVGNNRSSSIFYPAAYPDVIAVSSLSDTNQLSAFSNFGPGTDLTAPGENIIMAGSSSNSVSNYVHGSGSSFAAAEVTGAVSLLLSSKPNLTPAQASAILKATADPLPGDINGQYFGAGRLNIGRAMAYQPKVINATLTTSVARPLADGLATTTITATVLDEFNQPQVGLPIELALSGNANIVNGQLVSEATKVVLGSTDFKGQAGFTLASPIPETKQLTLTTNSVPINLNGASAVTFKAVYHPRYTMQWLGQSPSITMGLGSVVSAWVEVKNTGNMVWTSDPKSTTFRGVMRLGTARPLDRQSVFYDSANWSSQNRAAYMTPSLVRPGETAKFSFNVKANQLGNFKEYFRPVVDYVTWLNDLGIYWKLTVQ